ncbi:enoyl-CoA hydratase/carnithine racemase [Sphingopyxis panaciterrae]|uniref:enoyl-CoA hydratase/isomerase family protein n=1 Tax=Sphingopyxis panaciterrae TaxID=363841 RepID=UPI001420E49B|nr:enoyl-CoA hydratase/isomerase family protein [Sphingopyxis panaciterrae]NIJ36794.1 enoyl-CoA hydratase/carnithine racemase [Sphingopyxis panaciterrae]
MSGPDHLDADRLSAPGGQPVLVVDARTWRPPMVQIQALVIGADREGALPSIVADDFDLLLTTAANAPRPWVSLDARNADAQIARLADAVKANPLAATIGAQLLRLTASLPLADALLAESLAYSTLLGGNEFAHWRAKEDVADSGPTPAEPVAVEREGDDVTLILNDPANRNAMTANMRDALYEALANALDDPSKPQVTLRGAGRCFSTGGALAEFGTAKDLAEAHAVRLLHSCARALDALGERATVRLHGACIGSGIEVATAAHRRIAAPDAWFQLPELAMGLIPGAGGTATIARAIGRHRTCWMLLSGKRVGAALACEWGLVHAVEERP